MFATGRTLACDVTGFVPAHAIACAEVADRTNTIILFREPGKMAQGLIAEHYAMKGFRIDTKSCDWGPMSGFVCVDPRLTKDPKYAVSDKNMTWTKEALSGHVVEKYFGKVNDPVWKADVMPLVISEARVDELRRMGKITTSIAQGDLVGESTATNGTFKLKWRLIPTAGRPQWWLLCGEARTKYFAICVGNKQGLVLEYPANVGPVRFNAYETVLGLANPETKQNGFKAAVTADYDLLSVWPGPKDVIGKQFMVAKALNDRNAPNVRSPMLPGGVARMPTIDSRLQATGQVEHYKFGDVSARIMQTKVLLNSALIGQGFRGGNAIHHNDEVGNTALAKGSLQECMPIIGFVPKSMLCSDNTVLLRTVPEFKELAARATSKGFFPQAKPGWL